LIGPCYLVPGLDCWMIQNGSYGLLGAILPNGEVHYGGPEGHSHGLDSNEPALLSQFFCHPTNMSPRGGPIKPGWPRGDSRKAAGGGLLGGPGVRADHRDRMGRRR
jgi:hypothetical protein